MAGARLAEELRQRDPEAAALRVTVIGEERHAAYNRILLSTVVAGTITPRETRLKPDGWWAAHRIDVRPGWRVTAVDPTHRTATVCCVTPDGLPLADSAELLRWDELVLATGSTSHVPPVTGADLRAPGVVAFRSLDDCQRLVAAAASATHAVVVGGGLLGIEAARGLLLRGLRVTVVHPRSRPMERQVDADGGRILATVLRRTGAELVLGRRAASLEVTPDGRRLVLDDGSALPCDLLVLAAGVRPRTDLAASLGAEIARGIVVDDRLATSVPHVHAVGECVEHRGEVYGLVQPGWDQARVLADVLSGADVTARYDGTAALTRLKVHDIDLTCMGEVGADLHDDEHEVVTVADPRRGHYAKLVVRDHRVVGAVLLGGGDVTGAVTQLFDTGDPVPVDRVALLLGRSALGPVLDAASLAQMPGSVVICRCNTVTKAHLVGAWRAGATSRPQIAAATRATTGCGSCSSAVDGLCSWLLSSEPDESPSSAASSSSATATRPEPTPCEGAA